MSEPVRRFALAVQAATTARMEDLASLLESMDVGVADVGVVGRLRPCNAAMRAMLRTLAAPVDDVVAFACLGLNAADHAQLDHGEAVELWSGSAFWSLRRRGRWLLATDVTAVRHAESLVLAGARAVALARVAGTFVHDLNNHLNLGLALFSQLRAMAPGEQERRLCDGLSGGAQLAASLLRTLANLLQRDNRGRRLMTAGPAMTDAIGAVAKSLAQRQIVLTSLVDETVQVRASQAELTGLYVQMLLALAELSPRRLHVVLDRVVQPIAGGRVRPCARSVVTLHGPTDEARRALAAAVQLRPGSLSDLVAAGTVDESLPPLVLLVMRLGGAFGVDDVGDALAVTCLLPAAATS